MIRRILFILVIIIGCLTNLCFSSNTGAAAQKAPSTAATAIGPIITFESTECDFGDVDVNVTVTGTFKFTNTGNSLLKIEALQPTCGCIITELQKKEYQPGESGEFSVSFHTGTTVGNVSKTVYVLSNDAKNPRMGVTVKANVMRQVRISPDPILLSFRKPNGGCPDINVYSLDGNDFAITAFRSVPDVVRLDFDPNFKANKLIIKPTVNLSEMAKTRDLTGSIFLTLNHPRCTAIAATFSVPALYKANPPTLLVFNGVPGQAITRDKIWLTSNYNEDFEIESTSSQHGYIKATVTEKPDKDKGRYVFTLQITPPPRPSSQNVNYFTDNFIIKIKNGDSVEIPCRVFYSNPKPADAAK